MGKATQPPKCRTCGVREWQRNHVCGGKAKKPVTVAPIPVTSNPPVISRTVQSNEDERGTLSPEPLASVKINMKAGSTFEPDGKPFSVAVANGKVDRLCPACGNPLQKPLRGPWPTYCSPKCRVRTWRERRAD